LEEALYGKTEYYPLLAKGDPEKGEIVGCQEGGFSQ
jgi:hypothetical protein